MTMIKAVSIQPGEKPVLIEIDNHDLREYYKHTQGYVEAVNHPTGVTMYCNEDGVMLDLPRNDVATALFRETGVFIGGDGTVRGGIIVVGWPDGEGDDQDVSAQFLAHLSLDGG